MLIPQLLLNHSLKNLRRLLPPSQHLRTKPQPIRLNRLLHLYSLVLPHLLEVRVARPRRVRQQIGKHLDVFKAGLDQPVSQLIVDVEFAAGSAACAVQGLQVLEERGVGCESAVVAPGPDGAFLGLEVAAWFDVVVDVFDEGWPVCDASRLGDDETLIRMGGGEGIRRTRQVVWRG